MYTPKPKEQTVMVHNGIITARYNYSMIQEKIFNYVLLYLQKYYNELRKGTPLLQLDLFGNTGTEISVPLMLSEIADPDEYNYVRRSAVKMSQVIVEVQIHDGMNKSWRVFQGIFLKVITDIDGRMRNNKCLCIMSREVAEYLLSLEVKAKHGQNGVEYIPQKFTTFKYEIAQIFKNKYAGRMYKLLCSFQSRPSFFIEFEELKNRFGLKGRYHRMDNFKKRILAPIQEELMEEADLWFDIRDEDFCVYNPSGEIYGFHITIHTINDNVNYETRLNNIIYMFKAEFRFTDQNIEAIRHIITDHHQWRKMYDILHNKIMPRLKEGKIQNKASVPIYIIKSLIEKIPATDGRSK